MSVLSDVIAQYIDHQLDNADGAVEICRSALADSFGCTPSQITYVLRTRFSPVRGYRTESRRGGGGYVKVWRVKLQNADSVSETLKDMMRRPMSCKQAEEVIRGLVHMGVIEEDSGRLMLAAVSGKALQDLDPAQAAVLRPAILSEMLLSRISERPKGTGTGEE